MARPIEIRQGTITNLPDSPFNHLREVSQPQTFIDNVNGGAHPSRFSFRKLRKLEREGAREVAKLNAYIFHDDEPTQEVPSRNNHTEVEGLMMLEFSTRFTRRFVERQGHSHPLTRRRDHHYSTADKANESEKFAREAEGNSPAYKRQALTTAELLHSEDPVEEIYPRAPKNWERHLQVNSPVVDWSLFPKGRK